MIHIVCPHCGNERVVTARVPKDVLAILSCPACHELGVYFRDKAVAFSREIMTSGTYEERKTHLAGIIAELIDPDLFMPDGPAAHPDETADASAYDGESLALPAQHDPISEGEVKRFVAFDLKRIDEASYFRKHFG